MDLSSNGWNDKDITPRDLEVIQFTESLPKSKAFENYLFDNMSERQAVHRMTEHSQPIIFDSERLQTIVPEDLRDVLGDAPIIIKDLSILQKKSPDLSYVFIRFTVNGEVHSLTAQSDEDVSVYTKPNNYGDAVKYSRSRSTPLGFLAGLVYAREYSAIQAILESRRKARLEQSGESLPSDDLFTIEESSIEALRIGDSDMIERLIMTLGQFDGISETKTSALLVIKDELLLAVLTKTESPQHDHISNELDLSTITQANRRLGLSQQFGEIKAFEGEDFYDQLGEESIDTNLTVIHPTTNIVGWSRLCRNFSNVMQKELQPYLHQDDVQ